MYRVSVGAKSDNYADFVFHREFKTLPTVAAIEAAYEQFATARNLSASENDVYAGLALMVFAGLTLRPDHFIKMTNKEFPGDEIWLRCESGGVLTEEVVDLSQQWRRLYDGKPNLTVFDGDV